MYAWRSLSQSNFSFTVSDIEFLHMLSGLMESCSGISSCAILVGDRGGGVDTRSTTFSAVEVFVLFTLFGRPCCAPTSTNLWNCVSTGTLFAATYSIMSHAVDASSSLSSEYYRMISLHLPFPCSCSCVFFLFLEAAISFDNLVMFSLVATYYGSSVSISPLGS